MSNTENTGAPIPAGAWEWADGGGQYSLTIIDGVAYLDGADVVAGRLVEIPAVAGTPEAFEEYALGDDLAGVDPTDYALVTGDDTARAWEYVFIIDGRVFVTMLEIPAVPFEGGGMVTVSGADAELERVSLTIVGEDFSVSVSVDPDALARIIPTY